MDQTQYAFIIRAPGYHPDKHTTQLESPMFHSRFVGVESIGAAIESAQALAAQGVEIIELCGGFTAQEATLLRDLLPEISVGCVTYP